MNEVKLKEKFKTQSQNRQGVQGLQAITFCVVHINDEHAKLGFKRKLSR